MTTRVPVALRVDPIACDAFGYCAELLPELVALDEWGYPVVGARRVPDELVALAREAARQCPRRALLVAEADS
ncbi:MAG TPA: ferredoxin [Acidimicrobiales bacterium]|nr:ferredoxin [Acidimicrobiales bacterium]